MTGGTARRLAVVAAAAAIAVAAALLLPAAAASADDGGDDGGVTIVGSGNGGGSSGGGGSVDVGIGSQTGGGTGNTGGGTGGGSTGSAPDPGGSAGPGALGGSSGSGTGQDVALPVGPAAPPCTPAVAVSPQPAASDSRWGGADPATHLLYTTSCVIGWTVGSLDPVWGVQYVVAAAGAPPVLPVPAPPPPQVLAAQLWARMHTAIPAPAATTSPDFAAAIDPRTNLGRTFVNLWVWFWAGPDVWHPITQTLSSQGVSVTVTVTPRALVFDPGNGDAPVSCGNAPGVAWVPPADGVSNPDPTTARVGGCGYRYAAPTTAGRPWTATLSIRWHASWAANTGASGDLGDLTTFRRTAPFVVEQIYTVLVAGGK